MKLYYHPASTTSRIVQIFAMDQGVNLDYKVVGLLDLAYGLVYPQAFPHHKRPSDAVQSGTLDWGKQKTQAWLKILDASLIGPGKAYLCGKMIALGSLVRCSYAAYPNVERWLRSMKALKSWPKVHQVIDGFAASLKDKSFVAI